MARTSLLTGICAAFLLLNPAPGKDLQHTDARPWPCRQYDTLAAQEDEQAELVCCQSRHLEVKNTWLMANS
jgi:hypothetical protein